MLADPAALEPYQKRDQPFPVDAIVLKEEYEFTDVTCQGPILQWTVMSRLEAMSSEKTLDWRWQRVDKNRHVVSQNASRCYNCHAGCTDALGGYEYTCTVP